ncbi:hypothetical protein G6L32_14735 [Agrobacterium tumefaciens]|uniref:hypothetical protein n=1 Tax=Agrobacterium tumefaciens TaxID=358 RepID=UPI0015745856|nr:hypothetical protein [Agrobacterium tumefaciens]
MSLSRVSAVFEGLPCGGKTTLINELASHIPNGRAISEWVRPQEELCNYNGTIAAVRNDYLKSASMEDDGAFGLADRYYYSTVPYELAIAHKQITPALFEAEFKRLYTDKLQPPTHLIIVPLDVEESLRGSNHRGWPGQGNPWFSESFLRIYDKYYQDLLSPHERWYGEESFTKKLRLSSTQLSERIEEVRQFIGA